MLFFVSTLVLLTFSPANAAGEPPVAEAGLGLIAYVGDTVVLDGSGSYDPEGDALTYAWTQVGGPEVTIERGDSVQPRFEVSAPGTLRFALVVSDDLTASPEDTVEVVVPYEEITGVEAGCATVPPAGSAAGLVALGLVAARRRSRR